MTQQLATHTRLERAMPVFTPEMHSIAATALLYRLADGNSCWTLTYSLDCSGMYFRFAFMLMLTWWFIN